jgi:hypothetical protein
MEHLGYFVEISETEVRRWCASRLKEYGTMYFVSPAQ